MPFNFDLSENWHFHPNHHPPPLTQKGLRNVRWKLSFHNNGSLVLYSMETNKLNWLIVFLCGYIGYFLENSVLFLYFPYIFQYKMLIRYTRFLLALMHPFSIYKTWYTASLWCLEQTLKVPRWGPDFALKRYDSWTCASDRVIQSYREIIFIQQYIFVIYNKQVKDIIKYLFTLACVEYNSHNGVRKWL